MSTRKTPTPRKKAEVLPTPIVEDGPNDNPPPAPKKPTRKSNITTKEEPESPSTSQPIKRAPVSKGASQIDPKDAILAKYREAGWTITEAPKGTINQYIAHNNLKYHFIQVYEEGNAKHEELPKNQFIQNAMSNGAIPVYANCKDGKTVTLQDINTQSRIIIKKINTAQ